MMKTVRVNADDLSRAVLLALTIGFALGAGVVSLMWWLTT